MAYSSIVKPTDYFNTKIYTGNGGTQSITGVGFQPDWIWLKDRDNTYSHQLVDVVRGNTKYLNSDEADAEGTASDRITSFDSDGFSLGSYIGTNKSSSNVASWNWKAANSAGSSNSDGNISSTVSANTTAGFSIVSYTGTGSNPATVGHGLGAVPKVVLVKPRNDAQSWCMYHESLGNDNIIYLDTNGAAGGSSVWNNTTPTASVFTVNDNQVNKSSINYIAYCFTEIKGFSKFGKYTSNNTANDGPFIYTGFLPAFVMTKISTVGGAHWRIFDNRRESFNGDRQYLQPDNTGTESNQDPSQMDLLSNGFKLRGAEGDSNYNTETVFYWAFAEAPFVTVGTKAAGTAR